MSDDSPKKMIDSLVARGYSVHYFERVAQLPAGTLARWRRRNSNIQAGDLALLRMAYHLPWILNFLDTGDADKARQSAVAQAFMRAQIDILETLADRMTLTTLGDPHTVTRVRNIIYELRDSLGPSTAG